MSLPPTETYSHVFGQDKKRQGEFRTKIVIALTTVMMVAEIATGILFGSIALLADSLHMASHTIALAINVFAYIYARRQAHNAQFSFGTGKVNALGGYSGAVLLAIFSLVMAWESVERLLNPVQIAFDQAILVAVIGLAINGVSVFILGEQHEHEDEEPHHPHDHDHNLRAAYLHVMADALTSVLAIVALLSGKYLGLMWMDPLIGILGAILVSRWAIGLIRTSSHVLLDRQEMGLAHKVRQAVEVGGDRLLDLHVWQIGPNIYSASLVVKTRQQRQPAHYKNLLAEQHEIVHITVEVNQDGA